MPKKHRRKKLRSAKKRLRIRLRCPKNQPHSCLFQTGRRTKGKSGVAETTAKSKGGRTRSKAEGEASTETPWKQEYNGWHKLCDTTSPGHIRGGRRAEGKGQVRRFNGGTVGKKEYLESTTRRKNSAAREKAKTIKQFGEQGLNS